MMNYSNKKKPNFKKALKIANDILISSYVINSFPFSIIKVIKEKTKIACRSYSHAAMFGVDINDFGSKDAIYFDYDGLGIIFYNEKIPWKERQRFSLNHELGHYLMEHDLNNKEMYDTYEVEANFFAAQMLMPEQVINELVRRGQIVNEENLVLWFNVSKKAARKRLETLRQIDFSKRSYEEHIIDESILQKFDGFINNIAPKSFVNYDPYFEEELQRERDLWF